MKNTWPMVYLKEKKKKKRVGVCISLNFCADRPKIISLQLQTGENCSFFCLEAAGESLEREAGCH